MKQFRRFRFSLRMLVLAALFVASILLTYRNSEPWVCERIIKSGIGMVTCCSFSHNGSQVVIGGDGVRIYDIPTETLHDTFAVPTEKWVSVAAFSSDDQSLITIAFDGPAQMWDIRTKHEIDKVDVSWSNTEWVVLAADGSRWFWTNTMSSVKEWGLQSTSNSFAVSKLNLVDNSNSFIDCIGYFSNGEIVGGLYENRLLILKNVITGALRAKLWPAPKNCVRLCSTYDNSRIFTGSLDGNVNVWDYTTGKLLTGFNVGGDSQFLNMCPAPNDDTRLLVSCGDTAQVWRRRSTERWYGILALPECWLTISLALTLIWCAKHKRRKSLSFDVS